MRSVIIMMLCGCFAALAYTGAIGLLVPILVCWAFLLAEEAIDKNNHEADIRELREAIKRLKSQKADRPENEIVCPKCGRAHKVMNVDNIVDCACGSVFAHNTWYTNKIKDEFYI